MSAIQTQSRRELSSNSLHILRKRYLEPEETVSHMWHRVADGNPQFIQIMEQLDFLPNSPTLMNAGTQQEGKSTFSACFKFDVSDSMLEGDNSIIETSRKAVSVAKWGGGVGYYLGNLRAKGAAIRSVHRVACGPVNVLWWYNDIGTRLITQGGRRELAQMAILPWDHADIREFIHCKDENPQALRTFNISVSANNKFMNIVTKTPTVNCDENSLWNEIVDSAWKTGDPGLYFVDTSEATNPTPHLGRLTGTNPCGEVPLLNNEACNLGSINLGNFVTVNRTVDFNRLEEVVRIAIRFLNNILDRNCFPHPAVTAAVALTRKIGLGVMGWADMLALMHIHYDTMSAVELGGKVMKFINEVALDESIQIGKENGPFPGYQGLGAPCRNATRTCIAPTGTISILADASSSIEPHFALEWDRTINAGVKDKEEIIHERIAVWDRLEGFRPKTANEIHWKWHVQHQAAFQKYTDLAVSKTINMPNSATREDISGAYKMMYELGCKGGTIFRDGCRSTGEQVLKAKGLEKKTFVPKLVENQITDNQATTTSSNSNTPCRRKPPKDRAAHIHHITIGEFDGYVHAGMYDNGELCEIFVKASKEGSTVSGLLDSWAISFSYALQHGASLEKLVKKFSGIRFEPYGATGNPEIPTCTSVVDYIVRWLDKKFGKGRSGSNHEDEELISGMLCPDCQSQAVFQGGCLICKNKCGWSRCG